VLIDGDAAHAEEVAQRVTASLAEPFILDVVSASISASIGIAMAPPRRLLRRRSRVVRGRRHVPGQVGQYPLRDLRARSR
jgi:GGDEF domain-containing protein